MATRSAGALMSLRPLWNLVAEQVERCVEFFELNVYRKFDGSVECKAGAVSVVALNQHQFAASIQQVQR